MGYGPWFSGLDLKKLWTKLKFLKGYDTYIWKGVEGEYEKVGRPTYDHYVGDVVVFNDENGESGVMLIAGEFEYYGTTEFYNPRTKAGFQIDAS